jgi:hypothetical protein
MTKKRLSILFICITVFAAIFAAVFWPWQWTAAEATDSAGWKLTVHKVVSSKIDYMIYCIVEFTISPDSLDYYYKCTLSRRGRTVSSRTCWWPSYYPKNIQIEFPEALPDSNRTAVIQFDEEIEVHCSWSYEHTLWEEIAIFNSDLPAPTAGLSESDETFADEWKPPKNPDPREILREAQADARAQRYEDALAKHVWFHRNALKYKSSLSGVRRSFALSYWNKLGRAYPPALIKLREIRDEAARNVTDGKHVRESFRDLVAINKRVGEESHTKEIFVLLDAQNADVAKEVFKYAQPALINAKEYKLCGKYIDPIQSFTRIIERFRMSKLLGRTRDLGAKHLEFANKKFTNDAATLIALLVVNGRKAEAEEIAGDAKKEWNNASFHAEIDKALPGKAPKPWP